MSRFKYWWPLGLLMLALIGCENKTQKSNTPREIAHCFAEENSLSTTSYTVTNLKTPPLQPARGGGFVSDKGIFQLPAVATTMSFILQSCGKGVVFNSLENPSKKEMASSGNSLIPDVQNIRSDYANLLIPKKPDDIAETGTWTYRVQGKSFSPTPQLKLVTRNQNASTSTLIVQPYLTGTKYAPKDIQQALTRLKSIYENVGIPITLEEVKIVSGGQYSVISQNFNDPRTSDLVSKGEAGKINLFFVEDLIDPRNEGGFRLLGIAPGIPGSLGIAGKYNGTLIGLEAHVRGFILLDDDMLGTTAAHEMGHFLGLYHTTERYGTRFDPIPDTPECKTPTFPKNIAEKPVTVEDCKNRDGKYLMFWQGSNKFQQHRLSPQQVNIIKASPIAQ